MKKTDINNFQISPYFNLKDFCSPGTLELKVSRKLVEVCERLREFGPFRVVSGYRSPEYNREVGGVENSFHLQGKAVHLKPTAFLSNVDLFKLAIQIPEVGGLGLYEDNVLHIDLRPEKAYWIRVPTEEKGDNGKYRYFSNFKKTIEGYEKFLLSSKARKITSSLTP